MADDAMSPEAAFTDFCRRLEAVGRVLTDDEFPRVPEDRVEGFRHLVDQAVCWLTWAVGHGDARAPFFQRQNDFFTQWGGPNAENTYRHARVDPSLRYRIVGRMNSCEDFILAVRSGFRHEPKPGTLVELTASSAGIHEGDEFVLELGGPPSDDPRHVDLPEDAVMVSIREYYFDWRAQEPATMTIECIDAEDPPPRLTAERLVAQLRDAATAVEDSITYWNTYMRDIRARGVDNTFAPTRVPKGLEGARYGFCFYDLGPDDALVIETEIPPAPYWSLQLYTLGWFEAPDVGFRMTSVNHVQAVPSADGRVRAVVAHRDPGVPNWIDTEGRPDGLINFRAFWVTAEPEMPATRVVRFDALGEALPPDTPTVTPEDRARDLAARQAHIAWRFRT
jgi:hypothetical protein